MSDYVFGCPKCNREFRVLPDFADEVIQCPHCDQKMRIPTDYFASNPSSQDSLSRDERQNKQGTGNAAQLPPQFVASQPSEPKPERVVEPPTSIAANASIASEEKSSEAVTRSASAEIESAVGESGLAKGAVGESNNQVSAATIAAGGQPNISHLLPPQFAVLDPSRFKRQSGFDSHVFLPTADGGVQTVSDRLVTIEYKGEKYIVVAMSREEKRRRQIIVNIVSVIVAISAIVGTIWILLN